jgi:AcrR family transcriptional regulator
MDEKKEHILVEAERLFAHFGIKKTTMNDIAQKTRMSKSTLYYYFKSKEEVFSEVIKKDSIQYKDKLNQAITEGETPQEKIRNYVVTRMVHLKELSNYYSTLTEEYLEQFTFVENIRKEFSEYEISALCTLLGEGVRQGIFSLDNIEMTARNFAICLKGLEHLFFTKDISSDIEKDSEQMLTILFKGIETR